MNRTTFTQFAPIGFLPGMSGNENKPLITTGGGTVWDTLSIAGGGTGSTTPQDAINALTTGDVNLTGASGSIKGRFANDDIAARTSIKNLLTGTGTAVSIAPNGNVSTNAYASGLDLESSSSLSGNGAVFKIEHIQGSEMRLNSSIRGTAAYLPVSVYVNNVRALRVSSVSGTQNIAEVIGSSSSTLSLSTNSGTTSITQTDNGGSPIVTHQGSADTSVRYNYTTHTLNNQLGQHLVTVNASGAIGVGSTPAYGIPGQLLQSNGNAAATSWITATSDAIPDTIVKRDNVGNISAVLFQGTATSAMYADLAEVYSMDRKYVPGTVVKISRDEYSDCCATETKKDHVFGVISTAPAYLMNSAAVGQPVALIGRVPVRVVGPITKGDRLTAADVAGCATAGYGTNCFATALETNNNFNEKLVECALMK